MVGTSSWPVRGRGAVFAANVRGVDYDGTSVVPIAGLNFNAYPTTFGVNVAGGDVERDGAQEIATTPGSGPANAAKFRGFDWDGGPVASIVGFDVQPFSTLWGGRVGVHDINADGADDLLAGAGPDPSADDSTLAYELSPTGLQGIAGGGFRPFGSSYGVNVSGAFLGY